MKRIPFTLSLIAAAVIGTSPVLAQTTTASTATKPLCSSLNNPNAGKLAGKETGKAKEHSSSPVHQDCIPDSQASTTTSGVRSGTTTQPSISASTGSVTSNPPSVTGSASSSNSSVTGSTANSQNSVTGSTSTFTPNIDLRGRSSLTIDNTTTTGDQSLSSSTSATTGNQSLSSSTSSSTGDQSLSSSTDATTGSNTLGTTSSTTTKKKKSS